MCSSEGVRSDSSMTGRHWHWPEVVELATASRLTMVASTEPKPSSTKEGIRVMYLDLVRTKNIFHEILTRVW